MKKFMTIALVALASNLAIAQSAPQGSIYPMADCLRDNIIALQQKYNNTELSEDAEPPLLIDGRPATMNELHKLTWKDTSQIMIDYSHEKHPLLGSRARYGVIVVITKKE